MGNCWSCGASVGGACYGFTCPACTETAVMKDIRKGVRDGVDGQERAMRMIASGLSDLEKSIAAGLSEISDELSNIAAIVQGGFDEIKWELQQQTKVLLSIDKTLKNPSQTQAREWRVMAEELRKRGCFDESKQWFLKSIDMSPLDFRTYIGLAMSYLRNNDFDNAEDVLKRSLPHAPKGVLGPTRHDPEAGIWIGDMASEDGHDGMGTSSDGSHDFDDFTDIVEGGKPKAIQFDFKSLSHRLIGRIYACRSDYGRAAAELRLSIDLSPQYPEGNYDYALYCVQSGKKSGWEEPILWEEGFFLLIC